MSESVEGLLREIAVVSTRQEDFLRRLESIESEIRSIRLICYRIVWVVFVVLLTQVIGKFDAVTKILEYLAGLS